MEKQQSKEKAGEKTTGKTKSQRKGKLDELASQVEKIATRTSESIKKVFESALASRNTVLTIRVNDESNKKLNMLVDAGLFKSRSESAAFLILEGIKNQEPLFNKIQTKLKRIESIKKELKNIVSKEIGATTSQQK